MTALWDCKGTTEELQLISQAQEYLAHKKPSITIWSLPFFQGAWWGPYVLVLCFLRQCWEFRTFGVSLSSVWGRLVSVWWARKMGTFVVRSMDGFWSGTMQVLILFLLSQYSRTFHLLWSGDNSGDCIVSLRDVKTGIENCAWWISSFVDSTTASDRVESIYRSSQVGRSLWICEIQGQEKDVAGWPGDSDSQCGILILSVAR